MLVEAARLVGLVPEEYRLIWVGLLSRRVGLFA